MDSLREFFKRIKSRPMIFLLMMFIALAFSAAEAYNPVIKSYGSFSIIFKYNYMRTLASWTGSIKNFLDRGGSAYYTIAIVLVLVFVLSLAISAVLSGYINVLISAVNGNPKKRGEFAEGIKRNLLKTALYIFSLIILSAVLLFFLLYAVIPSVAMLRMFLDGNTGIIFTMLLMCILTVCIMLLAMVFFGLYFSYILPSIAGMRKSCLRTGIKMSNLYCWYLIPKTALFLFIAALIRTGLFAIHYGHSSTALSIVVLLITSILRTFLYYIYIYFIFNTFIAMRDDLYPDYDVIQNDEYDGEMPEEQKPAANVRAAAGVRRRTVRADSENISYESDSNDESEVTYTTADSYDDDDDDGYDDSF